MAKIGVIGGSGIYDLDGLSELSSVTLDTPFGAPSEAYRQGRLGPAEVVFLPRHGKGHRLLPGEINHRANIFGMKQLGVEVILSLSAVGSFREELAPGDIVLVDQFVDRTKHGADHTFFGDGIAAHIAFGQPTCAAVRRQLERLIRELLVQDNPNGTKVHPRGTYVNMEGPAFSTLAESRLYQSWGMDVIGMTNLGEAKLAREAEICYQTIALVTDYDCWHETHGPVAVEVIIETLQRNAAFARRLIQHAVPALARQHRCEVCTGALRNAIITRPEAIPPERRRALAPLVGKYLP